MAGLRSAIIGWALGGVIASSVAPAQAQMAFDPANEQQDDFVQGNFLFLAYHEAGHMLLDQLLGADQHKDRLASEQDADDIATWMMLPDPDEPEQDAETLAAIRGWEQSAGLAGAGNPLQSPHYPDDSERAARIVCLLYGNNPKVYADLRHRLAGGIDEKACVAEHDLMHEEFAEWFGEDLIPPATESDAKINVRYEAAGANEPDLQAVEAYLKKDHMLEELAEDIRQFVSLPNDITIAGKSCGDGTAEFKYSPSARQITACYEAIEWFMKHLPPELGGSQAPETKGQPDSPPEAKKDPKDDDLGSGGARTKKRPR